MLLLWIATQLALAAEPETEAADVPPTHVVAVELPDGVEVKPTARELAKGRRPKGVTFTVPDKPSIDGKQLVVEGVLHNTTSSEVKVFLASDKHREGPFLLVPRDVSYKKEAPTGRVSPAELVLPADGKAVFRSAIVLEDWAWPEGGAPVDWVFHFWDGEEKGSLPGMLSPP